jgi:biotin carboxylase
MGVDIVVAMLKICTTGGTLQSMVLTQADIAPPRGFAIQARVNLEEMRLDGTSKPTGGTLTAYQEPSGPGIRVDAYGYTGYRTSPNFDSMLAKVIAHSPSNDYR